MQVRQEKKHHRFRISILFVIVLLSFGGCFLYYMYNDNNVDLSDFSVAVTTTEETEDAVVYITDQTQAEPEISNPVPQNKKKEQNYLESCGFVGDTLVQNMVDSGVITSLSVITGEDINIKSINSVNLDEKGKPVSVSKKLSTMSGNNIYILLGTDSMDSMTNEAMLEEYNDFLDSVISDNKNKNIYIVSVPPVTEERENDRVNPILNSSVELFNSSLLDIADNKGVYYIDVNSYLCDSNKKLKSEFAGSDGKSLSLEGNQKIIEYILNHTV